MRRDPSDLPFSNARRRRYADDHSDDGDITYAYGRAYRRETSRHDGDYTITSVEQRLLHQRRLEAAEGRKACSDANFAAALRLGAALKVLDGEG